MKLWVGKNIDNVVTDGDNIEKQFICDSILLASSGNNYTK